MRFQSNQSEVRRLRRQIAQLQGRLKRRADGEPDTIDLTEEDDE